MPVVHPHLRTIIPIALTVVAMQLPASAAPAAGAVVLAGHTLGATGAPAPGADVYLFDVTGGDTTRSIAHTRADAAGAFTLALPRTQAAAVAATATGNGGWNDLMALTVSGGRTGVQYFSRRWDLAGRWTTRTQGAAPENPVTLAATHPITAPRPGTRAARELDAARRAAASTTSDGDAMPMGGTTIATYPNVPTTVARIEVSQNASATFTYGKEEDSDVDIGVSFDEGDTFKIGGSAHLGTTTRYEASRTISNPLGAWPVADYMKIGVNYEDVLIVLPQASIIYIERRATGWTGNLYSVSTTWDGCSGALPCDFEGACYGYGDTATKTTGRNVKFGSAAQVGGLSLGASSGWSTSVQVAYKFGIHSDPGDPDHIETWCLIGSNGWPPDAAQLYMIGTTTPPW